MQAKKKWLQLAKPIELQQPGCATAAFGRESALVVQYRERPSLKVSPEQL
jgi:hypothetical protein